MSDSHDYRVSFDGTETRSWGDVDKSLGAFVHGFNRHAQGDADPNASVGDLPAAAKRWIAARTLLGDPEAETVGDLIAFPVVNPSTNRLNAGALRAVLSGRGAQADVTASALERARTEARQLLDQHYGRDNALEYAELKGVEIFRTGTWNGDRYEARDLDDMVTAFGKTGFRVPVKLGHRERSGDRAFGWVENIRRVKDKLVADFRDVPEKVAATIREKGFDSVSAEIFWNLKRNGETFRRALKAVALLGAETPAVSDLAPLSDALTEDEKGIAAVAAHAYTLDKEDFTMPSQEDVTKLEQELGEMKEKLANAEARAKAAEAKGEGGGDSEAVSKLQQQLDELREKQEEAAKLALRFQEQEDEVKALRERTAKAEARERESTIRSKVDECSVPKFRPYLASLYELAFAQDDEKTVKFYTKNDDGERVGVDVHPTKVIDELVNAINKGTARLFEQLGTSGDVDDRRNADGTVDEDPGVELDRLANAYMTKHAIEDYRKAFNAVLNDPENAALKKAYGAQRRA